MIELGTLPEEYELINGSKHCLHMNYTIKMACCSAFLPLIECACQGYDEIVCPNPECDGVTVYDMERILGYE